MKQTILALFMVMALAAPALAKGIKTATIKLPTLHCDMCEKKIERVMKGVKGIKSFDVDVEKLNATVEYDSSVLTMAKIEAAIAEIGYDANKTPANRTARQKLPMCCQSAGNQ